MQEEKAAQAGPSAAENQAWHIRFGTAGESISFDTMGYTSSLDIPEYTARFGLHAFEYQCGRGVRLGLPKAEKMAALAKDKDILFSVHAPYFISMSSMEEDKRINSIQYLLQSCAVVKALGGRRVIFHTGSCGKQSREAALEKALDTMRLAVEACDAAGYGDLTLCPETMGKVGQLGTLDEVLALCGVDPRITPCIDFGHLNARTQGGIRTKQDYADILDRIGEALGDERAARFHVHFSRIEFTAGGEKRHWTFADTQFGPEPLPLIELLAERRLAPVVICESAGTQAEDASWMQSTYQNLI
jgi:endonuclease IV